jgi:hypothetical protein
MSYFETLDHFLIYLYLCWWAFFSTVGILFIQNPGRKTIQQIYIKDQFLKPSLWNLGHLGFYSILGSLFPNIWGLILTQSVLWEIIEFQSTFLEGNWLDILYNGVGYYIGNNF